MARYTLRVNKGATYRLAVVWRAALVFPTTGEPVPPKAGKVQPGPPISLAGCSARMQVRRSVGASDVLLELTSAAGEIELLTPAVDMRGWVRAATTANVTLSGVQTVDGVKLAEWDPVLVKDQTTASQNGLYVVQTGAWVRSEVADSAAELAYPAATYVLEGARNRKTVWRQANALASLSASQSWQRVDGVGQIYVEMTPEQTAGLESGVYDLEVVAADGSVTRLLEGKVRASSEVTRE